MHAADADVLGLLALVEIENAPGAQFQGLPEDPADTAPKARREILAGKPKDRSGPIEAFSLNSRQGAPSPSRRTWRRIAAKRAAGGRFVWVLVRCGESLKPAMPRPGPDRDAERSAGGGGHGERTRKGEYSKLEPGQDGRGPAPR